jgi:hypothetical protein
VGSIILHELNSTRTARWYEAASSTHRTEAWAERLRCFIGLSEMLAEQAAIPRAARNPANPANRDPRPPAAMRIGTAPEPENAPGQPDTVLQPVKAGTARLQQAQIAPRGLLTEVARRAHFAAHETVYKKFRAEWEGPVARWAGTDEAIKPRNALVAEAKIVSFWAYREGVLQIAAKFDMTLPEVAEAYLRALAAWASDDVPLAACRPAGPPACVAEDMAVLAALWTQRHCGGRLHGVPSGASSGVPSGASSGVPSGASSGVPSGASSGGASGVPSESLEWANGSRRIVSPPRNGTRDREKDPVTEKAEQLERLARTMVTTVLDDPTITPAGAFGAMRDDLAKLLAEPADPLADQLSRAAAQLSDRILHQAPGDVILTPQQASRLLTALTGLSGLLAPIAVAPGPQGADRGGLAQGGGR